MPGASAGDLALLQDALVLACDRLTSRGEPVRCLGSVFLPGPARLLTLFAAPSAGVVRRVNDSVHAPVDSLEAATEVEPLPDPAREPGPRRP